MSQDQRIVSAISHWGPRFVANGVILTDFHDVTSSIVRWEEWCGAWCKRAAVHEALGHEALDGGYQLSAADHLSRAAVYYHFAKFLAVHDVAEMRAAHMKAVACKQLALPLMRPPAVRVEIPYQGGTLAGFLRLPATGSLPIGGVQCGAVPASDPRPPLLIMVPGLDSAKEELDAYEGPFLARGMATLMVDGPGQGEAEYDFPIRGDYEVAVKAMIDWVVQRTDVDTTRIGLWGVSLGGYYAPRAAAFEQRFAACIAWGAQWDYWEIWRSRFEKLDSGKLPSLSVAWQHLLWIFNVKTREEAMKKLEGFRLDGVVQKITCPFLMVHGEGDEQIPLPVAQKCFDAVGSKNKTFKLFTREEGGYHHCQIDNASIGVAAMWDWLESVFFAGR